MLPQNYVIESPAYLRPSVQNTDDNDIIEAIRSNPYSKGKKKHDGFEFDPSLRSDAELCRKIFEKNAYLQPSDGQQIDKNLQKLIETTFKGDKTSLASIVGIYFLEIMGYAQLSYSIMDEDEDGNSLGMQIGLYASKKLIKKAKNQTLTNEDVYILKLKCLLNLGKVQEKELRANMNKYRIMLEKILTDFAQAFDIKLYKNVKSINKLLAKLHQFLLRIGNQKTVLLSYKLFKTYLRMSPVLDQTKEKEVADKIYNVFLPFIEALEFNPRNNKKVENLVTYQKIKTFIERDDVQAVLLKYPNLDQTTPSLLKRKKLLAQHVDFDQKICQLMDWDSKKSREFTESKELFGSPNARSELTRDDSRTDNQSAISGENIRLINMLLPCGRLSVYDNDIDECISPIDVQLHQYERARNPNDFQFIYTQNSHPSSYLNTDRNDKMSEAIINSQQVFKPAIINEVPSDEDEEEQEQILMDDKYLVIEQRPTLSLNPFRDPIKSYRNSVQGRESPIRLSIRNRDYDEKILDTKTESNLSVISTPFKIDQFEVVFQKLLSIASDEVSKWDIIKNEPKFRIGKIKPENSPVVLIRAICYLEGITPERIFDCIYDTKVRPKWDTVISNPTSIEKIDEFNDYFYFLVKAPIGISNRDFVQKRCFQKDYPTKGSIMISFQSTTHPKVPPIKGNVRAETHIAGYIIKSCNNGKDTELVIISQVDIKGSIPKTVVNFVAGKAPAEWITKLKKACK